MPKIYTCTYTLRPLINDTKQSLIALPFTRFVDLSNWTFDIVSAIFRLIRDKSAANTCQNQGLTLTHWFLRRFHFKGLDLCDKVETLGPGINSIYSRIVPSVFSVEEVPLTALANAAHEYSDLADLLMAIQQRRFAARNRNH